MDDDAFVERDVADYIFTTQRITAFSTVDQNIVHPADNDRVLHADKFPDGLCRRLKTGFFLSVGVELFELLRAKEFRDHISRQSFAVADRCKKIFWPAEAVFIGDTL